MRTVDQQATRKYRIKVLTSVLCKLSLRLGTDSCTQGEGCTQVYHSHRKHSQTEGTKLWQNAQIMTVSWPYIMCLNYDDDDDDDDDNDCYYLWCKICNMCLFFLQSSLRHKHWKVNILDSKLFNFPIKEIC